MTTKVKNIRAYAVFAAIVLIVSILIAAPVKASAEDGETELVTAYSDLWKGDISVKAGEKIRWYVDVPEDVTPRGCGATVKIPGLGFGTDTHNKEEGHIVLKQGRNFIYEFTAEETGEILFTCWMGSGCHKNYIHVTEDGTYTAEPAAEAEKEVEQVSHEDEATAEETASAEEIKPADADAAEETQSADTDTTTEDTQPADADAEAADDTETADVDTADDTEVVDAENDLSDEEAEAEDDETAADEAADDEQAEDAEDGEADGATLSGSETVTATAPASQGAVTSNPVTGVHSTVAGAVIILAAVAAVKRKK